jgi:sporulation protein YlmC with PRC-barrel domain
MTYSAQRRKSVHKPAMAAALAALMAMTTPLAYAQTTKPTPIALTTQAGQLRASQMIGSTVYDVQNRNIGSIKDLVLDRDGRVAAVVIDVGSFLGMGGKYVGVSLNDLKMDNDRLTLDRTKEQLQSAEAYQLAPNQNQMH